MEDVRQIGDDLRFVREAVRRNERDRSGAPVLAYLWAAYVLIGYTWLNFNPRDAGIFFAIGGFVGGILSWIIGKSYARRHGQSDRSLAVRATAHFGGGILLAWIFCIAMAIFIEPLRSTKGSQVFVVMIGLVYFLWGVHHDRYFLFLGPILMLGGVLVGLIPHYGWTSLGAVIALGLIAPTFFHSHKPNPPQAQPA
jgi:hypothetical protein